MWVKYIPAGERGAAIYITGRDASGRFECSTGSKTRAGAEKFAERYLAARARRRVPGSGEAVGFQDAADFYKAATPSLSKNDIKLVDAVAAYIGNVDCRTIVHAALVSAADALKPGRADATKNRKVIAPAAAVLHYAAKNRWCEYQRIGKFWESRKTTREPARDEDVALLLANAEAPPRAKNRGRKRDYQAPYKKLLLAMLYETGLRLSHLLSLEWEKVDLSAGRVRVRIPKSDELAAVPLSQFVMAMMANLPSKDGRLFPWATNRGVYAWLKPLRERLGVTYTPHMSRHKLATDADAAQIPDKRAALLGVWSDPRSLHRYQHVTPDAIPGRHAGTLAGTRRDRSAK